MVKWLRILVFCPGIEPTGNVVMKKAEFTVETISAGMGEVLVYVEDPAGHREEVRDWCYYILFQLSKHLIYYCCDYCCDFFIIKEACFCRLKLPPTMTRTAPILCCTPPKLLDSTR